MVELGCISALYLTVLEEICILLQFPSVEKDTLYFCLWLCSSYVRICSCASLFAIWLQVDCITCVLLLLFQMDLRRNDTVEVVYGWGKSWCVLKKIVRLSRVSIDRLDSMKSSVISLLREGRCFTPWISYWTTPSPTRPNSIYSLQSAPESTYRLLISSVNSWDLLDGNMFFFSSQL